MANFKTHLGVAAAVSGAGAFLVYDKVGKEALFLFVSGCIGGILPDIDHDNSIPLRILQNIFTLFLVFFVFLFFYGKVDILSLSVFVVSGYIGSFLLFSLFKKLTTHRGVIHSVTFGALLGLLMNVGMFMVSADFAFSVLSGGFLFLGYVTHLVLDEIYSIDFTGRRIKKSFGSALKFRGESKLINSLLFLIVTALLMFPPNSLLLLDLISILKGF